jgi:hypothetical protein
MENFQQQHIGWGISSDAEDILADFPIEVLMDAGRDLPAPNWRFDARRRARCILFTTGEMRQRRRSTWAETRGCLRPAQAASMF